MIKGSLLPRFHSTANTPGLIVDRAGNRATVHRLIGQADLNQFPGLHVQYCRRVLMECAPLLQIEIALAAIAVDHDNTMGGA
jgi:hypothetical protein